MPDIPSAVTAAKAIEAASRVKPWRTVRRHDRLVLQEYEDLITWARDDLQKEAQALEKVKAELAGRSMLRSGEYGHQVRLVRDEVAKRWRDRKRRAERLIAELREAEGWSVTAWRKLNGLQWPENPDEEELRAIAAAWEDEQMRCEAVESDVAAVQ